MATDVNDSEWENVSVDNQSEWEDVSQTTPQENFSPLGTANKIFGNSPMGIVSQGAQKLFEGVQRGADILGEKAATGLSGEGLPTQINPFLPPNKIKTSPEVAAAIGTGIQMAPDVLSSFAVPTQQGGPAVKEAVPLARRALGFQKSFLKTPFGRGQATKAAEMALEKGVIPYSGSPTTMFQRAEGLASKSGQNIGKVLEKTPVEPDIAIENLNRLRGQITKGLPTGVFSNASSAVNDVLSDLKVLANRTKGSLGLVPEKGQQITAEQLNQLKTRLGQKLNFLADLASQSDNKAIVNNLANTIRDAVKSFTTPEEFAQFLSSQKQYNAAQLMLKGLNNEIAGQMGNRAIGPYSVIAGAGQLASGNAPAAAATLGITEGLMKRGAGAGARAIQDVGTNYPALAPVAAVGAERIKKSYEKSIPNPVLKERILTKQKAAEFLDEANGDKVKARELAKAAGYSWTSSTK